MDKPRLLDLFSCAGGAAKGYQNVGFYVVGVDKDPQPHYIGDEFVQSDAFEYLSEHWKEFDVIHASPPCQRYSQCTPVQYRENHPDLIAPIRKALQETGKPYVIENVQAARYLLINPVKLCGSMFDLPIFRHRYFEIYPSMLMLTPPCQHNFLPILISGTHRRKGVKRADAPVAVRREAIGIDWMTDRELDEAIPPIYTQWIGERLLEFL